MILKQFFHRIFFKKHTIYQFRKHAREKLYTFPLLLGANITKALTNVTRFYFLHLKMPVFGGHVY